MNLYKEGKKLGFSIFLGKEWNRRRQKNGGRSDSEVFFLTGCYKANNRQLPVNYFGGRALKPQIRRGRKKIEIEAVLTKYT